MFCGRRYAAYACINAVYTAECECIFEVGRNSRVGALEVPPHRLNYSTKPTIQRKEPR